MKLKDALDKAEDGHLIEIQATEPGFAADIPAWCKRTGNELVSLNLEKGVFTAIIRKEPLVTTAQPQVQSNKKTMVIFSGDFGRAMAAFIIANGAATMGSEVTMFFTFWGLNLLRRDQSVEVKKTPIEKLFGLMMPRGVARAKLCKMNFLGLGTTMMKGIMKQKNVYSLETLMQEARKNGVRLIACTMTMDLMGIKPEELIDGVELGGVASYLEKADNAGYNVFI
jgi:peroxiredoxin family protein/TusA-related sulfurtransferase